MTHTMAEPPALAAERLCVGYGVVPVIHDLDLEIRRGEVVVLLGANGAGKTTTLSALSGVLPPVSGRVLWLGSETRQAPFRRSRQGLAYLTEERAVFASLTTAENLRLGRGGVSAALQFMPELAPLMRRRAGLLSGGEQQMLALARALASRPQVLLADELSLGLAPLIVRRLLRALRAAADGGIGVLLVEQHVRRALAIADRGYVLSRGQLVMSGTGASLRARIQQIEASYLSGGGSSSEG
jgi:branched-chain amino acid transport system ATP-binding protein